jgi:excisionase family DNA binding protein
MEWLTTRQAAEKLGVSDARVRAMIKAGRLPAQKLGHIHMINEADLKLVENRKVGRPRKAQTEKTSKRASKKKSVKPA